MLTFSHIERRACSTHLPSSIGIFSLNLSSSEPLFLRWQKKDHGFEFEIDGRLGHMPGAGPPTGSAAAAQASARAGCTPSARGSGGLKAPTYQVKEVGGWIHIFPDDTRPGSVEQRLEPLVIPEAVSPEFRSIEGSMDFKGGVDACVENMLDMLHISFVHTFGNMQDPTPFEVSYEEGFDDPETEALATSRVTFRYRSGSKSFSKVVAKSTEVRVGGRGGIGGGHGTVRSKYISINSSKQLSS